MVLDDGYQFGLGAFETIAVYNGSPILLENHIRRLHKALHFMGIERTAAAGEVYEYIAEYGLSNGTVKIIVSEKNRIIQHRDNPYRKEQYERGFIMDYSQIRRNETSPFTYHKTLNYGESILEKREAARCNLDEKIFLNTRGEVCEGAVSNIFFVRNERIFTPRKDCGLLPGIIRDYVCDNFDVCKTVITPEQTADFDECFITNSLVGVMPVRRLGDKAFDKSDISQSVGRKYRSLLRGVNSPI